MLSKLTFSLALVLMLAFALFATPVIAQVLPVDRCTRCAMLVSLWSVAASAATAMNGIGYRTV